MATILVLTTTWGTETTVVGAFTAKEKVDAYIAAHGKPSAANPLAEFDAPLEVDLDPE